jgi:hypothetical protein
MKITAVEALPIDRYLFVQVHTDAGIGVTLAPDAQARFPVKPRPVRARLHVDGSVVDQ